MKLIPLTQGRFASVDDGEFENLAKHKWHWMKSKVKSGYAARHSKKSDGTHYMKRRTILMHADLLKTPFGMDTDHRDGNGLNNQRYNLRICSRSENMSNTTKNKVNTTGFKGVYRNPSYKGYYFARICKQGKNIFLGYFKTAEMADKAYKKAAKILFGAKVRTS